MTGWTVLLRGVRHRTGRSLVVLLLAAIAVTAAVLTPAYARAAQQSVLTDTLREAPAYASSVTVKASGTSDSPAFEPALESSQKADAAIKARPLLHSLVGRPVTTVETEAIVPAGDLKARYVFRSDLCKLVSVVGDCPNDNDQVIVSDRTAKAHGLETGDRITLTVGGKPQQREIVGLYTPRDANAPAWGAHGYFREGASPDEQERTPIDAIFAGSEEDLKYVPTAQVTLELVYPVRVDDIRLDDADALAKDLEGASLGLLQQDLSLSSALAGLLNDAHSDSDAIAKTIPVVAVPLLLLVVGVLMLLVASLTEERGPEIALAKLRGYPAGKSARFGLGEVLFLIGLATPLGLVGGLAVAEFAARAVLAPGVHVEVRFEPFAAAAAALVAAFIAAWAGSRRTVRSGVLSLLRRVPHHTGWRAGLGEGVVVALAAAAVVAAWQDRTSSLALLAAPSLALVAGIAVARLLSLGAGARLALARRTGNVATMFAAAQLARRPGRHRVVAVVTVALALLGFSATAWDVAAQARQTHAELALGAARVYTVGSVDSQLLISGVRTAAPDGSAMPVLRRNGERYAGQALDIIALPASQLAKVASWPGHSTADLTALAGRLRPQAAPQAPVSGELSVRVNVTQLGKAGVKLAAMVAVPGGEPKYVTLGTLKSGVHSYSAAVPTGRFVGLALIRPAADSSAITAKLEILDVKAGGSPVVSFTDDQAWSGDQRGGVTGVTVTTGDTLKVDVQAEGNSDLLLTYVDTPPALPVALSGQTPDDNRAGDRFSFLAYAEEPQPFAVVERSDALPSVGERGFLVDLDYAVSRAEATTGMPDASRFSAEVWANANAPADLEKRLAAAGLTVLQTRTVDATVDQLGRRAPALAWRLYLLAGVVAAALALGLVLLVARLNATARRHELAALRVTGVPARVLRRGVRREHLALMGLPVLTGFAVGLGSAWLMLPGMPLVAVGQTTSVSWTPHLGAVVFAAAAGLLCLLLAVFVAVRLVRRAAPELLRGDV
ncbi:FtsX-like permease family protein [Hamadaea sp. NPDC050747]|uniref:FtsX-like permease family protein n=1 Tax=Hamadaea sp. NPDC050747 TaxID=3155789 RepID=UPI0033C0B507